MKKLSFLIAIIIVLLIFYSCKGKKVLIPTSSQWTFRGIKYKPDTTSFHDGSLYGEYFYNENYIRIAFAKKPVIAGVYTVSSNLLYLDSTSKNCSIWIHDPNDKGIGGYYSIGKTGEKINVIISNGKIISSFTNISVTKPADTTFSIIDTVSGTLVER